MLVSINNLIIFEAIFLAIETKREKKRKIYKSVRILFKKKSVN